MLRLSGRRRLLGLPGDCNCEWFCGIIPAPPMEMAVYILLFTSLYVEVFMLIMFLEYVATRSPLSTTVPTKLPSVAIIVPCYNESAGIDATLRSLLALEYPRELLDIVVVDDGSTDDTLARAQAYAPHVRVFSQANGGKHTAMNRGLSHAQGELVGCLDADSVVKPDALTHIVSAFADSRVAAVTPAIHVKQPQTVLQYMQEAEYRLALFNRFILAKLGSMFITPGPFSFFRTAIVRELGGWKGAHMTEDMEMAMRIQGAGHAIANAPRAHVYTATPRTLGKLYHQRVRWTYGFLQNVRDYRHVFGNAQFGHLGVFVLPLALISVFTAMFFFMRSVADIAITSYDAYTYFALTGIWPTYHFNAFYINTSAFMFLAFVSLGLVLALIAAGSWIGHETRRPPLSTPLFLIFGFITPVWLFAAVVRAGLKTGVRWR